MVEGNRHGKEILWMYLEKPKNPGKDDGRCALCEATGISLASPMGPHLVVEHGHDDIDADDG
jgi:hypothetical protein